ncbi:MAG: hypothetical protein DHS20C15_17400 [Planctomycetota bacterium]|nr:MAG: hypothetical protein DHS20C15_17400 [Planctomycetota bacterium]
MARRLRLPLTLALALCVSACGLVPDSAPSLRYFEPPLAAIPLANAPGARVPHLRVRGTRASAHLDTHMVYRLSSVESGQHPTRRWTQPPAYYVDLALGAALFESGRFRRSVGSGEALLSVELLAFEELRDGDGGARVELRAVLEDSHGFALLERRYEASVDAALGPDEVARALGLLLSSEVGKLAADVSETLAAS